jgi:phosphodiesterase/alkaline phosphatase D-like protein
MKRRHFIYTSLAGTGLALMPALSGLTRAFARPVLATPIVCFRAGSCEAQAGDGSWNICMMADPRRSQAPASIRLKFQVAVDPNFEEIISEQNYFARRKNAYILRINYRPPADGADVYYRFVSVDTRNPSAFSRGANQFQSSEARRLPLNHERA